MLKEIGGGGGGGGGGDSASEEGMVECAISQQDYRKLLRSHRKYRKDHTVRSKLKVKGHTWW